jgi:hypothetical protein
VLPYPPHASHALLLGRGLLIDIQSGLHASSFVLGSIGLTMLALDARLASGQSVGQLARWACLLQVLAGVCSILPLFAVVALLVANLILMMVLALVAIAACVGLMVGLVGGSRDG